VDVHISYNVRHHERRIFKLEPATIELIKVIATDGIKILGPAIITGFVAHRTLKRQFEIEKLRIHDKDRIDAYKRLYVFARKLQNVTFPLAEGKRSDFINIMSKDYFNKMILDSIYFTTSITNILDEIEEQYICMTRGELIAELDQKEATAFLENKLFDYSKSLIKNVRKLMKEIARSA
jgi:hypothetical protein